MHVPVPRVHYTVGYAVYKIHATLKLCCNVAKSKKVEETRYNFEKIIVYLNFDLESKLSNS